MLAACPFCERADRLAALVMAWWAIHENDTCSDGDGDERNVYEQEPEFIQYARALTKEPRP